MARYPRSAHKHARGEEDPSHRKFKKSKTSDGSKQQQPHGPPLCEPTPAVIYRPARKTVEPQTGGKTMAIATAGHPTPNMLAFDVMLKNANNARSHEEARSVPPMATRSSQSPLPAATVDNVADDLAGSPKLHYRSEYAGCDVGITPVARPRRTPQYSPQEIAPAAEIERAHEAGEESPLNRPVSQHDVANHFHESGTASDAGGNNRPGQHNRDSDQARQEALMQDLGAELDAVHESIMMAKTRSAVREAGAVAIGTTDTIFACYMKRYDSDRNAAGDRAEAIENAGHMALATAEIGFSCFLKGYNWSDRYKVANPVAKGAMMSGALPPDHAPMDDAAPNQTG